MSKITKIRQYFENLPLSKQIRYSLLSIQIPFMIMLIVCISVLLDTNKKYEGMIRSAVVASEFSLDFKKDFDDETYLLIVGNKTTETSKMDDLLRQALYVTEELSEINASSGNAKRLKAARKYLENLGTYKNRIELNLQKGDKYEENIKIWENDIQIVSTLLQETMSEYIYYEIRELQVARDQYQAFYIRIINIIVCAIVVIVVLTLALSLYLPKSISKPIEKQVTEEQTRLRKAELELLQSQINPHFLYNTLDTIVWAAEGSDQKTVVSMVKSLSEFFRTSLNSGREIVTIREEIQHARSYLEIQHVRYRDILEYEINIPESLWQCMMPKITIQPLIENALYHGIKNKRGVGKIVIAGTKQDNVCEITVSDNGKGMDSDRLSQIRQKINDNTSSEGEIFGLSNVNERIQLKFGKDYGITVESQCDNGTKVTIRIPYC